MPIIKCDYLPRPYMDNGKLAALYSPIIPIRISANHKMYPYTINSLVDSGADFNLMPAELGEYLGLKIQKGTKSLHRGIGNVDIVAYIHTVNIYFQGHNFKTQIHFSYVHRIPLLGRYGFFRFFKKVSFNEKMLQLELRY